MDIFHTLGGGLTPMHNFCSDCSKTFLKKCYIEKQVVRKIHRMGRGLTFLHKKSIEKLLLFFEGFPNVKIPEPSTDRQESTILFKETFISSIILI